MRLDALDFSALQSALAVDQVMAGFTVQTIDSLTENVSSLAVDMGPSLVQDPVATMEGFLVDMMA